MDRTLRCELLARLSDDELHTLVDLLGEPEITVTTEPTIGMVMMRVVEDAHGEQFNLGEVLVSECQVRVGLSEGWAMLLGSRPDAARRAATIDAAITDSPALADAIDPALTEMIGRHDERRAAEVAELAPTRVRFETQ